MLDAKAEIGLEIDERKWSILHILTVVILLSASYFVGEGRSVLQAMLAFAAGYIVCSIWGYRDWGRRSADATAPLTLQPLLDRLDRIEAALSQIQTATATPAVNPAVSEPDPSAKQTATERKLAELKAAQAAADPVRVLELHDEVANVLLTESRQELDGELAKWFMALIMKRLRTGNVGPEVADLTTKVADRFGQTMEGASLRASLPTLRRSAGLCARCSRPYRGIADACPVCLAAAPAITTAATDTDEEADEVEKLTRPEESPFLDLEAPL